MTARSIQTRLAALEGHCHGNDEDDPALEGTLRWLYEREGKSYTPPTQAEKDAFAGEERAARPENWGVLSGMEQTAWWVNWVITRPEAVAQ